jgi:hypothetical protein
MSHLHATTVAHLHTTTMARLDIPAAVSAHLHTTTVALLDISAAMSHLLLVSAHHWLSVSAHLHATMALLDKAAAMSAHLLLVSTTISAVFWFVMLWFSVKHFSLVFGKYFNLNYSFWKSCKLSIFLIFNYTILLSLK